MMPDFNLIDRPWIPCTLPKPGEVRALGIRETLLRAVEIREISDSAPPVTAALHRLLVAILHRNFGPRDESAWAAMWRRGEWDREILEAYLQHWHPRFDLFAPERPFYQTTAVGFERAEPATRLSYELVSGWNPVLLFDHTLDGSLPPAAGARYLVAQQAFSPGGTISLQRHEDPRRFKFAKAAPLTQGALALLKGNNLFQTLMLSLHRYSPEDEEPFATSGNDVPAWEREVDPEAGDRYPSGYLDLLTWQSRRIRLEPETDSDGQVRIRRAVVMKGEQFPDGWQRHSAETMLAFQKRERAKPGEDPWPPLGFEEEKAVWRDSLALFQTTAGAQKRPRMVSWLSELVSSGILRRSSTLSLELYGISTSKASVLFWRHERLPLPLAYLDDRELLDALKRALRLAEDVGTVVYGTTRSLAELLLAPTSDQPNARKPDRKDVTRLVTALAPERAYWSRLEVPFEHLLVRLPADHTMGEDGSNEYGSDLLPEWAGTLRRTARDAFAEAARGLESSGRTLKALALAQHELNKRLSGVLRGYLPEREEVHA